MHRLRFCPASTAADGRGRTKTKGFCARVRVAVSQHPAGASPMVMGCGAPSPPAPLSHDGERGEGRRQARRLPHEGRGEVMREWNEIGGAER
jgi:hypothetical protein